jgi:hypothetical protein
MSLNCFYSYKIIEYFLKCFLARHFHLIFSFFQISLTCDLIILFFEWNNLIDLVLLFLDIYWFLAILFNSKYCLSLIFSQFFSCLILNEIELIAYQFYYSSDFYFLKVTLKPHKRYFLYQIIYSFTFCLVTKTELFLRQDILKLSNFC